MTDAIVDPGALADLSAHIEAKAPCCLCLDREPVGAGRALAGTEISTEFVDCRILDPFAASPLMKSLEETYRSAMKAIVNAVKSKIEQ